MSHKEKFTVLLDEMGVFYVVAEGDTEDSVSVPAYIYGTDEERAKYKNAGYRDFSADLHFDKEGSLKEFGIWE